MPITKSAKRALRGATKKAQVNQIITSSLEKMVRKAKKSKTKELIEKAASLADRAAKKKVIHRNKAARIKSQLARLLSKTKKEKRIKK